MMLKLLTLRWIDYFLTKITFNHDVHYLFQANMIGKTVRDFVHPTDHKELEKHFIIQQQDKSKAYKGRQSPEPMEMDGRQLGK